uniref:Uncharacterized protein n=1 Tax=Aegilops tauschii subsp. strangulata TaxID=200361 RepID=A0A453EAY5_AEGTS
MHISPVIFSSLLPVNQMHLREPFFPCTNQSKRCKNDHSLLVSFPKKIFSLGCSIVYHLLGSWILSRPTSPCRLPPCPDRLAVRPSLLPIIRVAVVVSMRGRWPRPRPP